MYIGYQSQNKEIVGLKSHLEKLELFLMLKWCGNTLLLIMNSNCLEKMENGKHFIKDLMKLKKLWNSL